MNKYEMPSREVAPDAQAGVLRHGYRIACDVPLNKSHPELAVNVLEYREIDKKGKQHIRVRVTNLMPTPENAEALMRAGRARWHTRHGAPRNPLVKLDRPA